MAHNERFKVRAVQERDIKGRILIEVSQDEINRFSCRGSQRYRCGSKVAIPIIEKGLDPRIVNRSEIQIPVVIKIACLDFVGATNKVELYSWRKAKLSWSSDSIVAASDGAVAITAIT